MANNNVDGEIILGLDISQTKSTIEKDLEQILKQINNLEVSIAHANLDNQAISELQKKLTQISNLTVNVSNINVNPNQVRQAQQAGQQTGELVGKAFQEGLKKVTSKGTGKRNFYKIDPNDAKNFENAMKKQVNQWTKGKGNLIDVKISTRSSFDSEIGRNIERLHQATVTYNNELGETIKKTVAWRQIGERTINGITEPIMGFAEVQGQYSKSLDNTAKATNNFVNKQKKATATLQNDLAKIKADYESQNKTRPIKNENSQQQLASKYIEVEQAVNAMSTASEEAFVDAEIYAKKLINELEIMVTQFRDAETASNKMKGINVEEGVGVATANFDKIKAQAQEVGLDLTELSKRFETLISDKSKANLDAFNDQLRVSQAELDAANTKAKLDKKNDANKKDVYALLDKRTQAYQEILTINEKISRLNPETDSAQIKDLERQRNEWSKINQEAAETMTYYAQQVLSEEELVQLAKDRANALKQVQNNVATSFAASDEKQSNKESNSTAKRLQNLQNKLDTEQPKHTTKYIDEQVASLQKYGIAADEAERQVKELRQALADMSDTSLSADERLAAEKKYQTELNRTSALLKQQKSIKDNEIVSAGDYRRIKVVADLNNYIAKNTAMTKESRKVILQWIETLASSDDMTVGAIKNINSQWKQLDATLRASGRLGLSTFDKAIQAWKKFGGWGIATGSLMTIYHQLTKIPQEVIKLDTTLVELSKVSDLTASGLSSVTKEAYDLGKQVAKTGTDVLDSVTSFKRAGYDIKDSMVYAEEALKTTNISENLKDAGQAADSLVNIMKGFQAESPEFAKKINDAVNQVSNTQAVGFDNLVDGATRLSAVANQAGMSFEQMLGTLTGGYEILGDMEKVATGQITIFSRLQSIQLDGEDEVATVSKLQKTFNDATKGAVNIVDSTTGQLRNVYDILDDMANVWGSLDKNTREALAIEAAGIRQKNVFLALMQNWQGVEDAVESAKNSMNSADEENQKYLDSIEGRMNSLESSFQRFSQSAMSSGLIKGIVSGGTVALDLLTAIMDKVGVLLPMISGGSIFAFFKNLDCQKVLKIA